MTPPQDPPVRPGDIWENNTPASEYYARIVRVFEDQGQEVVVYRHGSARVVVGGPGDTSNYATVPLDTFRRRFKPERKQYKAGDIVRYPSGYQYLVTVGGRAGMARMVRLYTSDVVPTSVTLTDVAGVQTVAKVENI